MFVLWILRIAEKTIYLTDFRPEGVLTLNDLITFSAKLNQGQRSGVMADWNRKEEPNVAPGALIDHLGYPRFTFTGPFASFRIQIYNTVSVASLRRNKLVGTVSKNAGFRFLTAQWISADLNFDIRHILTKLNTESFKFVIRL